ncbi:MAG TPA: hypothetical protein VFU41_00445 [Gemmatimonadales bacterium]|nr:hypothetical protein [Gemmatimonadales bacterium]
MTRPAPAGLALLLLLGACERPDEQTFERELAAKILTGVVTHPRSTLVSVSAGQDAVEATFATPADVKGLAAWYRQALELNGWQVRTDQVMADGSIAIHATSGQRPLWITMRANVGGPGTTYTLVGAIPAPDTLRAQPSGSSMSSNRIQRR